MEEILKAFPSLTATQIEQFHALLPLYKEWNEKINLTAITEDEEVQQQIAEIAPSKTAEEVNVRDLLMNQSAQKLGIALKEASPALKEQIVEMAMSLSIADPARVNLIKHYCNVDILQALALQR